MALKLIEDNADEPVTLDEAKQHCRIESNDDDVLITARIKAARQLAEHETRRALATQTWDLILDQFPCQREIIIPKPPLQSVTYIKYVDSNGIEQTLSTDDYKVDDKNEPGKIVSAYGKSWPSTRNEINAVTVRFICGYGEEDMVPEGIRSWMLLKIATLDENRESLVTGFTPSALPDRFVDGLLDPYRVFWIG